MTTVLARVVAGAVLAMAGLAAAPAVAPAAPLIAAFERYVPGQGFDIGLVDATTGAAIAVPSGVNTPADEFHPALALNGDFLTFTRATLVAQPDGDVVPPESRSLRSVDRRDGTPRLPFDPMNQDAELGAGATVVPGVDLEEQNRRSHMAAGYRVKPAVGAAQTVVRSGLFQESENSFVTNAKESTIAANLGIGTAPAGSFFDVPHAAVYRNHRSNFMIKATAIFRFSEGNGSVLEAKTQLVKDTDFGGGPVSGPPTLLLTRNTPRHVTPRTPDGHLALDIATPSGTDIATMQFPGDSAPSPLAPVNTSNSERIPAWSPDGVQLGFVRTTGAGSATPTRNLLVFDSTVGLQNSPNPAINLGAEAPTPQLREFQATWGGLSLALAPAASSSAVSCLVACAATLTGVLSGGPGVPLQPFVGTTGAKKASPQVGIVIARRVGTRSLFGKKIPRIRNVGRVPLGIARSSKPRFRWNGRVNGRKLPSGKYLLTFRTLTRKGRVLSTSRSIQFTLRKGRVTEVRALKS